MSRFLSRKLKDLVPYTPGEQPKTSGYIKLNTNESPFPPSKKAQKAAVEAAKRLQLYPDPTCRQLTEAVAKPLGLAFENLLLTNGSDEILNFAFLAFCDREHPAVFCDITYGFYQVFAQVNGVPCVEVPLKEDFSVDVAKLIQTRGTIFLANPNAPTGLALPLATVEEIVKSDRDRVVVVDEAYVDFGGESAVKLIQKYDNLLVTRTFSKSRSMAGARLGFGAADPGLIADLNAVKYSTNPYNINSMTMAAGLGVMADEAYTRKNCRTVIENRESTAAALRTLGFTVTDSQTNFIFAKHPQCDGELLANKLKEQKILVRHFSDQRIKDYNRITVGTKKQMDALLKAVEEIIKEETK